MFYSQAQSLANSPSGSIKAVFTFEDFSEEIQLSNLSLQVTLGNVTKTIPVPFREALIIETSDIHQKSKVQFQLEETDGDIVGYTELKLPASVFILHETEINQKVQFQVVKGPKTSFTTTISVIFLNKQVPKEKEEVEEVRQFTTSSSKKTLLIDNRQTTPTRQRKSQENSPLPKKDSLKQEQYSINQLINLNKSERNIPNSFFDESSMSQFLELDSPNIVRDVDSPSSPTKSGKKLSRKNTVNVSETKSKKVLRSSLTQVFGKEVKETRDKTPKASHKKQNSLYESVSKLTNEPRSANKVKNIPTISLEPIDLNDDKSLPDVLNFLEQALSEHELLRAYVEYVKNNTLTLEFKTTEMDILRNENEKLKQQAKIAEESKIKSQERATAAMNNLKNENEQLRQRIAAMSSETEAINNKYQESQNNILKLKESFSKQNLTISQKDNELTASSLKNTELTDTRNNLKKAQESLVRAEAQRTADQKNFSQSLEKATKAFEDAKTLYDQTVNEKRDVSVQLNEEKVAHHDTRNRLVLIERQLENAEAYKEAIRSLQVQRDELLRQLAELRADRDGIYKLVEKTQADMSLKLRDFEKRENEYIQRVKLAEESLKAYELKNATLAQQLEKSELNALRLNSQVTELTEVQDSNDKMVEEVERLKEKLSQTVQHSVNLNSGIDNITENHDSLAQRTLELERANNDLMDIVAEKQQEIAFLKQSLHAAIHEIPKYVPIKDDPVDSALANILNANKESEKYRLLFIREAEGVYQFGTKKIYIKIEGDRVLIRVGGGYMTLEELLETVAPTEYDKLQKYSKMSEDIASSMVAKNIVLNQVITGKCVNAIEKAKTQAYKFSRTGMTPSGDSSPVKGSFSSKTQRPF